MLVPLSALFIRGSTAKPNCPKLTHTPRASIGSGSLFCFAPSNTSICHLLIGAPRSPIGSWPQDSHVQIATTIGKNARSHGALHHHLAVKAVMTWQAIANGKAANRAKLNPVTGTPQERGLIDHMTLGESTKMMTILGNNGTRKRSHLLLRLPTFMYFERLLATCCARMRFPCV